MTFGEWLKEKRVAARLSQEELADRAGCSKNYVSVLERRMPHPETGALPQPSRAIVTSLATALNVSLKEALSAAGYAPEPSSVTVVTSKGEIVEERTLTDEDKRKLQEAAALIQSILGKTFAL